MSNDSKCLVQIFTDHPHILNMASNEFVAEKGVPAKISLKFVYTNEEFKEYTLFVLKNGEPWQKILIAAHFV